MTSPQVSPSAAGPTGTSTTAAVPVRSLRVPFSYFARCTENRVEDDYDGGLLVFTMIAGNDPEVRANVNAAHLALNATHDSFLDTWPASREDKQARFFRITVEEVDLSVIPPDPDQAAIYDAVGRRIKPNGALVLPIEWAPGREPKAAT